MFTVLDLFSGIGGFHLGIEKAGLSSTFQTKLFVEKDEFCQQILKRHFPSIPVESDVRQVNVNELTYDIIAASPPCPPFSCAGKQKASNDERDLFPEILRLIKEGKPQGIILENVPQIINVQNGQYFRNLIQEIAQNGYICEWGIYSVADLGGLHQRKRCFILAYSNSFNLFDQRTNTPQTWTANSSQSSGAASRKAKTQSRVRGSVDGFPIRMDGLLIGDYPQIKSDNPKSNYKKRLFRLGNAICPQQVAIAWQRLYKRLTGNYG